MLKREEEIPGQLSSVELALIKNSEVIVLKTVAMQKIRHSLELLQLGLLPSIEEQSAALFKDILFAKAKISKGENYLGLPYLVLDYPARFTPESIFTFRTFFWWGNFFSFTLHLQGIILEQFRSRLLRNRAQLKGKDLFLCIHDSPWFYTYDAPNYKPCDLFTDTELQAYFTNRDFIKISSKMELDKYSELVGIGVEQFNKMIALMH